MKRTENRRVALASVIAVHGLAALVLIAAAATARAGDEVRELTEPTSRIEGGAGAVSDDSAKFGEYNGLDKSGAFGIGAFDLRFGGKDGSPYRWRFQGKDLGLERRSVNLDGGKQDKFRLTLGYDEIKRNYSDTYQTLWRGAGTTTLTLPPGYPDAASRVSSTTTAAGALANWNNIQSPYATAACATTGGVPSAACQGPAYVIPANMVNFDIGTKRTAYSGGLKLGLGSDWELTVTGKHQKKEGTKLTGVNMNRFSGPSALMPEPIDSSIGQYEASLRYAGKGNHLSLGYYGSLYSNNVNLWTVEYAGAASTTPIPGNRATMSGMPDNQMHQFSLSGGHDFSKTTRLLVSGAYSRMTQNEAFLATPAGTTWVVPEGSAEAKVINTSLLARLTSQPLKQLSLNLAYKYDNRDNKTPIEEFLVTPDITGNSTQFENEPITRRLQQFNLDADRRFGSGQAVSAGYEWQELKRSASGEESPFPAETTRENTLRVGYRSTLGEKLTGRLTYAYSQRRASDYEDGDPRPTSPPPPLPAADPLLPGFRMFFLADRDRDKVRGILEFQATESLSWQAGLDYNRDKYPDSTWGVKESSSWALGVDGAWARTEKLTFNVYYSYEDMKSRLESLAIARGLTTTVLEPHTACAPYPGTAGRLPEDYYTDPCREWGETQAERVHTAGLGWKSKGLASGKLDLAGGLTFTRARTPITVTGGSYYSNGLPTLNNVVVLATSFPDITSTLFDVRLSGTYKIRSSSEIRLGYLYRNLDSSDWQYDAYTNSRLGVLALQGYIGNNLTSPNYSVNVVAVSYTYRFQ